MSNTVTAPGPRSRRRPLILGLIALLVIIVAGGGYFGYRAYLDSRPGDLNTPSPLGDMAIGPANAPVTIIEYASMTCPHCAAFTKDVFPKLKATYVDTGKAHYVFREYPLDEVAFAASIIARCIAKDDAPKFFDVIEVLFGAQNQWVNNAPIEPLMSIAKQFGMNEQNVKTCLDDAKINKGIIETRDYALDRLGVNSTPTFFVNGQKVLGETPVEDFAKIIDPILSQAPAGQPASPKS